MFAVDHVSIYTTLFRDKLIIFLKDGNVITFIESDQTERVDDITKAYYKLTTDQLNQLKGSNIHTVKYSLSGMDSGTFSASNKEIETSKIISEFFKE